MASSSRGLFSYSSEKAVKEGTLHLDQIKVYSVSFWESNCVLILRKVPAHNYHRSFHVDRQASFLGP